MIAAAKEKQRGLTNKSSHARSSPRLIEHAHYDSSTSALVKKESREDTSFIQVQDFNSLSVGYNSKHKLQA